MAHWHTLIGRLLTNFQISATLSKKVLSFFPNCIHFHFNLEVEVDNFFEKIRTFLLRVADIWKLVFSLPILLSKRSYPCKGTFKAKRAIPFPFSFHSDFCHYRPTLLTSGDQITNLWSCNFWSDQILFLSNICLFNSKRPKPNSIS